MEHFDTEILKERKRLEDAEKARFAAKTVEHEIKSSIHDEFIEIYQIPTRFQPHLILEERASMWMPVDFEPMSQREIQLLFPSASPPKEMYGNSYSNFVVALNWTEHQMGNEHLPEFLPFAKQMVERMGPKARVLKTDVKKRNHGDIAVMEVVANALGGVSYSYIFYTILEGRLVMGTILFDRKHKDRLLPIAEEMVESFAICQEETQ